MTTKTTTGQRAESIGQKAKDGPRRRGSTVNNDNENNYNEDNETEDNNSKNNDNGVNKNKDKDQRALVKRQMMGLEGGAWL